MNSDCRHLLSLEKIRSDEDYAVFRKCTPAYLFVPIAEGITAVSESRRQEVSEQKGVKDRVMAQESGFPVLQMCFPLP